VTSVARVKWREVIESFVLLFVHFFFLYMYGDNLRRRGSGGCDCSAGWACVDPAVVG
jgi:hypothetical protein